jgi:hypothetical protein
MSIRGCGWVTHSVHPSRMDPSSDPIRRDPYKEMSKNQEKVQAVGEKV